MPQQTEPKLLVQYNEAAGDNVYSYADLTLVSALPDASQIEVRWDVNTVTNALGASFNVDDLENSIQLAIKTLVLNVHYTIDAEQNSITIIPGNISGAAVSTANGQYIYPTFDVTGSEYLQIRRSTDVTNPVVTFQPGARLTSENLNLANSQMFNAIQELTEFGTGGDGGTITDLDLSQNVVNDLSNVNLVDTGLLSWDGNNVTSGDAAGLLVPDNELEETDGKSLMSSYTVGGPNSDPSYGWAYVTYAEVYNNKNGDQNLTTKLGSLDVEINDLETVTQDLSRPTNDATLVNNNLTLPSDNLTVTAGNLTVTAGDIVVTAGDVTIQGQNVLDGITPSYLQLSADSLSVNVPIDEDRSIQSTSIRPSITKIASSDWSSLDEATAENITFTKAGVYKVDLTIKTSYGSTSSVGNLCRRAAAIKLTPSGGLEAVVTPRFFMSDIRASEGSAGDKLVSGSWLINVGIGDSIKGFLQTVGGSNSTELQGYTLIITKVS